MRIAMNVQHRPLLGLSVAMALMGGAVVWGVGAQVTAGPNDGRGGLNEFVGVTPTPRRSLRPGDVITMKSDPMAPSGT